MAPNMATNKEKGEYVEDFTPKTANRKINKPLLIGAALVILLAGLGIGGYLIYEGNFYYQTDNAKVDTTIYQLTANARGKLVKVYVSQGEEVKAGQVLARVDNGPYIKSPIDGTVLDVKLQEGDFVTASDVVAVVANTADIGIKANVEETDILKIHEGQSATVSLDAYGQSFDGYVEEVDPVTSAKLSGAITSFTTSGTYTKITQLLSVKIKLLEDIDLADIIGTNATVKIRIK
jgi:multidrug resistance efflux pump